MAEGEKRTIGPKDVERAVRSVAELFAADTIVIIGSQGLLVGRNDIDRELRFSKEIDAYPANFRQWERDHPGDEASETINAMLGEGSQFHQTHGFFVDGVDEHTAVLAPGWADRAVWKEVQLLDGDECLSAAPLVDFPIPMTSTRTSS